MPDSGTLVLTDVVDSTALTEQLGDAAMSAVWTRHDRGARDLLLRWRGREIDKSDGFLLLFATPADAVAYVLDYHRLLAALTPPLRARAGIHHGALTLRSNPAEDVARGAKPLEVEGLAKSVVARVMALADGGQTLLTANVRAGLDPALATQSHGFWRLKGVDAALELFEVGDPDAPWRAPADAPKAFRVLRHDDAWLPVREVRHNLAAERDGFVGRRGALQALARRLDRGRLVSVLGTGGTGKTRLATRFGWDALGEYPGGVWFCDLSAARGIDGIAHAVAEAFDVPLGRDDPLPQLAHVIAGRGPCLVILDNFEQVARHAEVSVGLWLARTTEARFIVTTREVLGIPGEQTLELDPLGADEGVELFRQRARAAAGNPDANAAETAATVELVRILEGLPLAIELAAARIRTMSPRTMLTRMHDRFALLWSRGGRHDRQATLRGAFDWSWELLDDIEKSALAQLSVFRGGFGLEAARAVLRWPADVALHDPVNVVQALLDKSLVRHEGESRFTLLESVREYAAEHLRSPDRFPGSGPDALLAAEQRHGAHYASLSGSQYSASMAPEMDNLVVACRRAIERRDPAVAVTSLNGVWNALLMRGPFRVGLRLSEAVHALVLDPAERALADLVYGLTLAANGRVADGLRQLHVAADGAAAANETLVCARALIRIAVLQNYAGQPAEAERCGLEALEAARANGDSALLCSVLNSLGEICDTTGRPEAARRHYEDALALATAGGHSVLQSLLAANLAQWHAGQGHHDTARTLYTQAIAAARAIGNRQWEANSRCNLGLLLQTEGQLDAAKAELQEARAVAQDLGDMRLLAVVHCNLGLLAEAQGDCVAAASWHADAAALARANDDRRFEGLCLTYLGRVRARQGDYGEAHADLDIAETKLRATGDRTGLAIALCARAETRHRAGEFDAARASFVAAEEVAAELRPIEPESELGQALHQTLNLLAAVAAQPVTAPHT